MIALRITLAFAATVSALALRHDSARAAQIAPAIAARIDFVVEDAMTDAVTPGASIAIERDGAIIYAKGYGRSDRRDTPASVFAMGSITKQFVAAAILQLSDAGKVNLDAPVGTYLPMFSAQRDLTVRNLLRQSSGLVEFNTIPYILNERIIYSAGHVDRTPLLVAIAAQPLRFRPGAQFMYSNTNYLLLSEIVSRVTHTPYEAYLRSHVFSRAGLTQTFAGTSDDKWSAGAGSLHSTPGDLLRWDDALFGGKVISKGALTR
jgi:D-alanyl-D-alanine carboxypeptidase